MVILSSPQQAERAEIGERCFRYLTMFLNVPVHRGQNKANKIFIANLEYLETMKTTILENIKKSFHFWFHRSTLLGTALYPH